MFSSLGGDGRAPAMGKGLYSQMMQGMSPVNGQMNALGSRGVANGGRRNRQFGGHT